MVGIRDDVVAISDILYGGQRFGSVGGMAVKQRLCRGLLEEAGLGDPKNRG
jgi:hypothetical protein